MLNPLVFNLDGYLGVGIDNSNLTEESNLLIYNAYKQLKDDNYEHIMLGKHEDHVTFTLNNTELTTNFGRFALLTIFITPLVRSVYAKKHLDDSMYMRLVDKVVKPIIDAKFVNNKQITPAFNFMITEFININMNVEEINFLIGKVLQESANIGAKFNKVAGNTISIYQLYLISKQFKEFDKCLNYQINENQQIADIEKDIDGVTTDGLKFLEQWEGTMGNLARSGTSFNSKQMGQVLFMIGFKPSLKGKTLERPVNSSFLRGLSSVKDVFIIGKAARKAAITNHMYVRHSGYLGRKMNLTVFDTFLVQDDSVCATQHPIKIEIKNKKILERFDRRNYICYDVPSNPVIKMINSNDDTHLIGQTLEIFSPTTCSHPTGHICKKCYGGLYVVNSGIQAGIFGATNNASQMMQKLLSTKHLLQTKTYRVEYNSELDSWFNISKNTIILNDDSVRIIIKEDDIQDGYGTNSYVNKFTVVTKGEEREYTFQENLYLSNEVEEMHTTGDIEFSADDLKANVAFTLILQNHEANHNLHQIINILEKADHGGCTDINSMVSKAIELMIEAGIHSNSVHLETIIRPLIRMRNLIDRPDFNQANIDYMICTLQQANINSSLGVSLVFERHKQQLSNINVFDRTSNSMLDCLYLDK